MSQPAADPSRLEKVRAKLLADPNTAKIAETLKMELPAYIELVLKYAANPSMRPQVAAIPDDVLRAHGAEAPSKEEVGQLMQTSIEQVLAFEDKKKTVYDGTKKAGPQVLNPQTEGAAGADERTGTDQARQLKEEMEKKLKGTKY